MATPSTLRQPSVGEPLASCCQPASSGRSSSQLFSLIKASLADLEVFGIGVGDLQALAPEAVVIVTRAAGEATAYGGHGEISLPAPPVVCVDATGGGDAFIGGVLAHLVEKGVGPSSPEWTDANLWTQALARGHSLGALAVSKLGGN